MRMRLDDLASALNATLHGPADLEITGLATPEAAGEGQIAVVFGPKAPDGCLASALVVGVDAEAGGTPCLRAPSPRLALAQALALFHTSARPAPGVHPTAVVAEGAVLGEGVHLGPYAVVGEARIGARTVVSAHCVIEDGAAVGEDGMLHPRVTILRGCVVGARVILHAGVVLGADGFGYEPGPQGLVKIPQAGSVAIGDDVEIGALSAVDRATMPGEVTRVGDGCKIDNFVQIAHNAQLGRHVIVCGCTAIAGSIRIGDGAVIGGAAMLRDHIAIGAGAQVAGAAAVYQDVAAGEAVAGHPATGFQQHLRSVAALAKLPDLLKRVRRLERRLGEDAD